MATRGRAPLPMKGAATSVLRIEAGAHDQARIAGVAAALLLLGRAGRIVAQGLHGYGGLGPDAAQIAVRFSAKRTCPSLANGDLVIRDDLCAQVQGLREPMLGEARANLGDVRLPHLQDRAELFAEERASGSSSLAGNIDVQGQCRRRTPSRPG